MINICMYHFNDLCIIPLAVNRFCYSTYVVNTFLLEAWVLRNHKQSKRSKTLQCCWYHSEVCTKADCDIKCMGQKLRCCKELAKMHHGVEGT
jgi:hypothetical protein